MKPDYGNTSMPLLALILFIPPRGFVQEADEQACRSLADLRIAHVYLNAAVVVPEEERVQTYCRVLGYVPPAINFEIKLPMEVWNDRFPMGGYGSMNYHSLQERAGSTNKAPDSVRLFMLPGAGHCGEDNNP